MKLFLAAPASGLPSELTALGSHASRLHFFRKLLSAAPASAFPFLSTALLAQVAPCESAGPTASATTMAAKRIRFIVSSSSTQYLTSLPIVTVNEAVGWVEHFCETQHSPRGAKVGSRKNSTPPTDLQLNPFTQPE